MPSIDPGFVPLLRLAFAQSGLPADLIDDDGQINLRGLVGLVVQEVEIRTAYTPPRTITITPAAKSADAPSPRTRGAPSPSKAIATKLQPTVEVRTSVGDFTLKPYGDPGPIAWRRNVASLGVGAVGLLLGVVTVGFFIGRFTATCNDRRTVKLAGARQLPARSVGSPLFGASSSSSPSGSGSESGGSSSTAPSL